MAFSSRVRTYHAWQNADNNAKRVKLAHESNRAQGKIPTDQLTRSLASVAEVCVSHSHVYDNYSYNDLPVQADRRAVDAKQEFDSVSRLVKTEVARFEQERIEDFKNSLETLLDGMIARQKEVCVIFRYSSIASFLKCSIAS